MVKMRAFGAAILLTVAASTANGQLSAGFSFLKAVEQRDGGKATELLQAQGSTVINFQDDKGNAALHMLAGKRDGEWLAFMLGKRANPNLQNRAGDTPLLITSRIGYLEGADLLLRSGAKVDLSNRLGETPLIVAVQQRQLPVVRRLRDHQGQSQGPGGRAQALAALAQRRIDVRRQAPRGAPGETQKFRLASRRGERPMRRVTDDRRIVAVRHDQSRRPWLEPLRL